MAKRAHSGLFLAYSSRFWMKMLPKRHHINLQYSENILRIYASHLKRWILESDYNFSSATYIISRTYTNVCYL